MISAAPGATYTTFSGLGATGLAGTAGYTVYKADGTVHTGRTTSGIVEIAAFGLYVKSPVAPAAAGFYLAAWDDGTLAPGHFGIDDLLVGSATDLSTLAASLDAIRAKTDMLGTGVVLVDVPLVETEPDTLRLVRGDDYNVARGRAIGWELEGVPSLVGTTVNFRIGISGGAPGLTQLCEIVNDEELFAELTAAQTSSLTAKKYTYELEQVVAGKKATLLRGNLEMTDDLSAT